MDSSKALMTYLRVIHCMSQQLRGHFGKLNLTFPQTLVLIALGDGESVPISSLAERTGSANSTVSGVVDRLEKLGLARRERSESDRRVIRVSATERYQELRRETEADIADYFDNLLGGAAAEERDTLVQALRILDTALNRLEEKNSGDAGA